MTELEVGMQMEVMKTRTLIKMESLGMKPQVSGKSMYHKVVMKNLKISTLKTS